MVAAEVRFEVYRLDYDELHKKILINLIRIFYSLSEKFILFRLVHFPNCFASCGNKVPLVVKLTFKLLSSKMNAVTNRIFL